MVRRSRRFRLILLAVVLAGMTPLGLLGRLALAPYLAHPGRWAAVVAALLTAPCLVRIGRGLGEAGERGLLGPLLFVFYASWAASIGAGLAYPPFALLGWALGLPAHAAAMAALAVGLAMGCAGVGPSRTRPRLVRVDVPMAGLPAALDGYRIAQLSDLHVGIHTPPARVGRWVDRVNALGADLVTVTGDLITSGDAYVAAMARELGRLRAPAGVALCLGNHDYFTSDPEALVGALEREGIDVLRNRGRVVGAGAGRFYLAGVDDTWRRRDDVAGALAGRPPGMVAVLLAHDPALFERAADLGADLVLSGHTHGGQIALPLFSRTFNVARIAYRHTAGLYRRAGAHLYVSRGAGTTGPPVRLGSPAEITLLTLRPARAVTAST